MSKAGFNLLLCCFCLIMIYLLVPQGVSPKEVASGYSDLADDESNNYSTFDRSLFISYKETTLATEADSGDLSSSNEFPRYLQGDYADVKINRNLRGTIASSGCGYTCYAMLVSWVTGEEITPDLFVNTKIPSTGKTIGDGYDGNGIDQDYTATAVEELWNIKSSVKYTDSTEILDIVKKELDEGRPIMVGVNNRPWTNNMHRIIILEWVDKDNSLVKVVDPNTRSNARALGMSLEEFYANGWKIPDQFSWYAVVTFEFPE